MEESYTPQDLIDNLDYLNETKGIIKNAIISKGQTVEDTDTFRSYAQKIEDIQTVEDLSTELLAQDTVIQEIITELEGKAAGGSKPNVYMKSTEPSQKDGIWLKSSEIFDQVVFDNNVYGSEEWNTEKIAQLKPIPYQFYNGSVVSVGTDIYLVGGSNSRTNMYKYNTLTDTYTKLTDIPFQFYGGPAVLIGTDIYLFGGVSDVFTVYKYNTLTDTYTKLTNMSARIDYGSAVSVGTDIYLLGGSHTRRKYV